MPLDKSGTKASVGNNIKTELVTGKPKKQAIAIGLNVARENGANIPKPRKHDAPAGKTAFKSNPKPPMLGVYKKKT